MALIEIASSPEYLICWFWLLSALGSVASAAGAVGGAVAGAASAVGGAIGGAASAVGGAVGGAAKGLMSMGTKAAAPIAAKSAAKGAVSAGAPAVASSPVLPQPTGPAMSAATPMSMAPRPAAAAMPGQVAARGPTTMPPSRMSPTKVNLGAGQAGAPPPPGWRVQAKNAYDSYKQLKDFQQNVGGEAVRAREQPQLTARAPMPTGVARGGPELGNNPWLRGLRSRQRTGGSSTRRWQ